MELTGWKSESLWYFEKKWKLKVKKHLDGGKILQMGRSLNKNWYQERVLKNLIPNWVCYLKSKEQKWGSLSALHKICDKTGFLWPVLSCIMRESANLVTSLNKRIFQQSFKSSFVFHEQFYSLKTRNCKVKLSICIKNVA